MSEPIYAYVKNGDAVDQVNRIMDESENVSTSGPDAFLADFLIKGHYQQIKVLSRHRRNASTTRKNVVAEVVKDGQSGVAKLIRRVIIFAALLRKLLAMKPDRILCGSTGSRLWAAYAASRVLGVPIVHSRHNRIAGAEDALPHRLSAKLDGVLLRRLQGVICHGPYLVDEIKAQGVTKDKINEFDIDFADYESARKTYEASGAYRAATNESAESYLLFVGRLEVDKGVIDLLNAAQELMREDKNLKLVFAGDGLGKAHLKAQVERLGLEEQVQLLGRVDHAALVPLFIHAKALIAPTRPGFPEGRCMSVMESLVLGTPAIVPNFGPFPYLIDHEKNGLLFKPGSTKDLETQLTAFIKDSSLANRLTAGAVTSGHRLSVPPRTFNEAVELAFDNAAPNSIGA